MIRHNTLPEFKALVARFKQTGSLGAEKQPVAGLEDELKAHFARESYSEFALAAKELDWVEGQTKPQESLDNDGRAGHYRADVTEGSAPESGYAEYHQNHESPAEVMRFFTTPDGSPAADVLVALDQSSQDGSLDILTGQLNGNSLTLTAFHFAPDGSATQEIVERTAKGIFLG